MSKKKAPRVSKRAVSYGARLKTLRKFVSGFDSKSWEKLYASKPRTAKGKRAKALALNRVRRVYQRLRPFASRPAKVVRPRTQRNLNALADFVGMAKLKGLRAIPVPTDRAEKIRVSFDRKGRVKVSEGNAEWKAFLFPHKPRNHYRGKKIVKTLTDDLEEMTAEMVLQMPPGMYVLMTRHHFLIPDVVDRDQLGETIRRYATRYGSEPQFLSMLYGFKWISGSYERAAEFQLHMKTERGRAKWERKRLRAEAKAKIVRDMDRAIKSGRISKRARATGRR